MKLHSNIPTACKPVSPTIYWLVSIVMVVSLVFRFLTWLADEKLIDWQYFGVTEFLINYQGGFVRRGLLGEILYQLATTFNLNVYASIIALSFAAYILVLLFFFREFLKKRLNWWLVLSPFLCGFLFAVVRKDYLSYLLVIAEIYVLRDGVKSYAQCWLVALIAIFGLLLHEAFIFYGVPIAALLILRSRLGRARIWPVASMILAFLVLCLFKGDENAATVITDSWNALMPHRQLSLTDENSIGALQWTISDTFHKHFYSNFYSPRFGWLWVVWRIAFFVVSYYFITNFLYVFRGKSGFNEADRTNISALYLFSVFCLIPMFTVLSCDNGRVYQYAWMITFIAFLLLPRTSISGLFGNKILNALAAVNEGMNRIVRPYKWLLIALLLLFAEGRVAPHLANEFQNSPVGCIVTYLTDSYEP